MIATSRFIADEMARRRDSSPTNDRDVAIHRGVVDH
jgi:hypothetical protein